MINVSKRFLARIVLGIFTIAGCSFVGYIAFSSTEEFIGFLELIGVIVIVVVIFWLLVWAVSEADLT